MQAASEDHAVIFPTTSYDREFFNPLAIPELKPPVIDRPRGIVVSSQSPSVSGYEVQTALDPRFSAMGDPHREYFVPASEVRPPAPAMSIPLLTVDRQGIMISMNGMKNASSARTLHGYRLLLYLDYR